MPIACTFNRLQIEFRDGGVAHGYTFTLRRNSTSTALTCSLTTPVAGAISCVGTNPVAAAAGPQPGRSPGRRQRWRTGVRSRAVRVCVSVVKHFRKLPFGISGPGCDIVDRLKDVEPCSTFPAPPPRRTKTCSSSAIRRSRRGACGSVATTAASRRPRPGCLRCFHAEPSRSRRDRESRRVSARHVAQAATVPRTPRRAGRSGHTVTARRGLAELGLRAVGAATVEATQELACVCRYACLRKGSSKAGSILILRFFHGYFPSEIAQIARCTPHLVDDWLRIARREARLFREEPHRLRFLRSHAAIRARGRIGCGSSRRTGRMSPGAPLGDFSGSRRPVLDAARTGARLHGGAGCPRCLTPGARGQLPPLSRTHQRAAWPALSRRLIAS